MTMLTTQQMLYLVALDDHRHFGRAATACFVSQPALSSQIREVEKRLGATLFERTSRGVLVTSTGAEVVRRSRAILRSIDDLVESVRADDVGLRGALRLGIIPTLGPYVLPRVVPTITTRFPSVELRLVEERTERVVARLRDGDLDLALLATEPDGEDLTVEPLARDPFHVALSTAHPLARSKEPIALRSLEGQQMLLLEDGHCLRTQSEAACHMADVRTADIQATSLTSLVQMVAAGIGITLLPSSAVALEARAGNGIVVRPLRRPVPERTISLVWRASSPRTATFRELAALLRPALGPGRVSSG